MAYNTILIKRRLPGGLAGAPASLSGGEIAFNEVDSTLYYGASSGVISIAGDGAFVNRTTDQTISGNKTFLGSTTLSSTTFSSNSDLDFGGNVLTNIGVPVDDADATTKLYVDTVASNASTGTESLSTEIYNTFVKLTDDREVNLTGGLNVDTITTTGAVNVGTNLTVTGNLSVLGTQTIVNTETINISGTSTQIDVVNNGTATGITVNQTGNQDVAEFKDDGNTALIIKGGATDGGYVGIGTATPNEKLTVAGNLSASGTIYGASGLEVSSGGGSTTLYVENGKVGVNTETPNEAFTVVGDISATADIHGVDIFASNADLTGTLDVTGASTFASTVSAAGALTVDGTATFNNDVTVVDKLQVQSTNYDGFSNGSSVAIEGTSVVISDVTGGFATTYSINSVYAQQDPVEQYSITTEETKIVVTAGAGTPSDIDLVAANTNITTGELNVQSGNLNGSGTNYIQDFIIDGGTF